MSVRQLQHGGRLTRPLCVLVSDQQVGGLQYHSDLVSMLSLAAAAAGKDRNGRGYWLGHGHSGLEFASAVEKKMEEPEVGCGGG